MRITDLDVCVLQIINRIVHAHTPLRAKYSFLPSVRSEGAGMCQEIKYPYTPLFSERVSNVDLESVLPWLGLDNE